MTTVSKENVHCVFFDFSKKSSSHNCSTDVDIYLTISYHLVFSRVFYVY